MTKIRWAALIGGFVLLSAMAIVISTAVGASAGFDIGERLSTWRRERRPLQQLIDKSVQTTSKSLPATIGDWTFLAVEGHPRGLVAHLSTTVTDSADFHAALTRIRPEMTSRMCGHTYTQSILKKGGTLELRFENTGAGLSEPITLDAAACGLTPIAP